MITDTAPPEPSESSPPSEPTVSSPLQEPTQSSTPESSPPSNRTWAGAGVFVLIIVLLIGGVLVYRNLSQPETQSIPDDTNSTSTEAIPDDPLTKLGVVIRNAESTELPVKKEIDQVKLNGAVRAAWDEALQKSPTNLVTFPNDPQLIAFRYFPTGSTEPQSVVLYKNRAVIVDTQPVANLPNNAKSRISLSGDKYQLLIKFEYTPAVTELDLPTILTEAFNLAMSGNRDTPQAKSIPPIIAFDALVR